MSSNLDQLKSVLQPFVDSGEFRVVQERYDPKSFGNAILVAESQGLWLRIVVDRSQVIAEVGSPRHANMWFDLELVLIALKKDLHDPLPWTHPSDVMNLVLEDRHAFADFLAADLDVVQPRLREAATVDRKAYCDSFRARRLILERP